LETFPNLGRAAGIIPPGWLTTTPAGIPSTTTLLPIAFTQQHLSHKTKIINSAASATARVVVANQKLNKIACRPPTPCDLRLSSCAATNTSCFSASLTSNLPLSTLSRTLKTLGVTCSFSSLLTCAHDRATNTSSQAAATTATKTVGDPAAVHCAVRTTPASTRADVTVENRANSFDLEFQRRHFLLRVIVIHLELGDRSTIFRAEIAQRLENHRRPLPVLGANTIRDHMTRFGLTEVLLSQKVIADSVQQLQVVLSLQSVPKSQHTFSTKHDRGVGYEVGGKTFDSIIQRLCVL
jgi:hypothetical protein